MKALVLCGGMPQVYLVKELKNRGIVVLLADQYEKAPAVKFADKFYQVSALDVDAIRKIATEEKVDFVISVCADQMLLVAAQVSQELGLPCYIDYETAKNVSNKEYMKQILVDNGIPTARYIVGNAFTPSDIESMNYPLVVKPVDTYGSRGVIRVNNLDELQVAFYNAVNISRTGTAIIEEFVDGDELSVDIYVENGIVNILCIRLLDKIPGTDGFIICRGRYPALLSDEISNQIQNISQKIAQAFGLLDTPMLIQMKIDEDSVNVIEFSARTGGGIKYRLIPQISGFDVVKAVLDLTIGKKPYLDKVEFNGYIIDEFLYCKPGVFDYLDGFDDLLEEGIIEHYEQFKASGHNCATIASSGSRVAYFSVQAASLEELKRLHKIAESRVKAVSKTGEDLIRHDIIKSIQY